MTIFFSWSGEPNREIGHLLEEFVSVCLGTGDVFMSDANIEAGERPLDVIDSALKKASAAFVLVSTASMKSPWLNYELGSLGARFAPTRVTPVLLDLDPRELIQPIAQFQAIRFDDRRRLLAALLSLNAFRGDLGIHPATVETAFAARYPEFVQAVGERVSAFAQPDASAELTVEDMFRELLATTRAANRSTSAQKRAAAASDILDEDTFLLADLTDGMPMETLWSHIRTVFPHAVESDETAKSITVTIAREQQAKDSARAHILSGQVGKQVRLRYV